MVIMPPQPAYVARSKYFSAVGAFSHKFSLAPSGETTDWIKKVRGVQKWDGPPLSPCQVVGIVGRAPAVDRKKCDVFVSLFCCHAFELQSL